MLRNWIGLIAMVGCLNALGLVVVAATDEGGHGHRLAKLDFSAGPKPSGEIFTNEVVYLVGDAITLSMSMQQAGHVQPKTFFLYLQDLQNGDKLFVNTVDGLLGTGEVTDIVGNAAGDAQLFAIPEVDELILLGDGGVFGDAIASSQDLVGNHRFVLEMRDPAGANLFARFHFSFCIVENVVPVASNIATDTVWTSNNAYLLDSIAIFVQQGATLTIEPGTYVLGANLGTLVISQGAKIIARGTPQRPIVMTSAASVGTRQRSDWGGLIVNGRSPINVPGGAALGEGDTGQYGGSDPDDNSGVIAYVRVEFAGFEFSPDNELNGIAFQGVGAATELHHIQVHFNKDDGIEMFGGTANLKYIVLTGIGDDSLDYTEGWQGLVQFLVAQQRGDDADQGGEFDNNGDNNELTPRATPVLYNATFIGAPTSEEGSESDQGLLVREGTAGIFRNMIVTGFKEDAVNIDQSDTFDEAESGALTIGYSIFFNNGSGLSTTNCAPASVVAGDNIVGCNDDEEGDGSTVDFLLAPDAMNRFTDPGLRRPFDTTTPDFRPMPDSIALDQNFVATPPDVVTLDGRTVVGFFTPVDYTGAVGPFHDWTQDGWTYFGAR